MPKIFWKVFLWFWLTVLLAAFTSFWLGDLWSKRDESSVQLAHLQSLAASAESILEERGIAALRPWMRRIVHRSPLRIFIIDLDKGTTLRGRELPPYLEVHLHSSAQEGGVIESEFEGHKVISLPLENVQGRHLRMISEPRIRGESGSRGMRFVRRVGGSRMLIAFGVTILLCLLIAYWLVRPIRQMQQAARRFGEGDFSARSALQGRKDEIGDLAREFDAMAERIESMMASQQRLLRDVSHELRSPLARLQVALELARKQSGKEQLAQFDRIALEAQRLDSMIGDMLALVRLESGEVRQSEACVELADLVGSIVSDANFEFTDQHKQIQVLESAAVTVKGDASLLHSAIENIVRNAMKYTSKGTAVELCLRASAQGGAEIEVRDFGDGVPEASLSRLFEPFYRVGEARDRQSGGFGLGLSIASRVVQSHGGDIVAENAEGGGLRVRIALPLSGC